MAAASKLRAFVETFRSRFEPALEKYLNEKIRQLGILDPVGQLVATVIRDFTLGGGKRVRAALVVIGYQAAGNGDWARILGPTIAIELFHSFFLIHDDITDRSDLRRNRPTVHRVFGDVYRGLLARFPDQDREHFARSMALLAGDLCCAIGYEALTKSDFPADRLITALQRMHTMVDATLVGQVLDILAPIEGQTAEETVTKIHLLKTARYTFEAPLHLGMLLAGATPEEIAGISEYAIPVGIAFQIQDDLLGVFGSETELGKSVTSDLEEGKQTLLTAFVRTHGNQAQRDRLSVLLGKRGLTAADLAEVQAIFREVGAVAYCEDRARQLVVEGTRALSRMALPQETRGLLEELAEYVVSRAL